jgi:cell division protein FtsZ
LVDFADVRTVRASRGPALMRSGFGEGENRAQEAAQEAISSPLLDNVSIAGARGVLINITGGMDLAIDEVTTISSIIQGEAGDDAEIIFGAVHDPALQGKIRVTVIATGFDSGEDEKVIPGDFRRARPQPQAHVTTAPQPVLTDIEVMHQAGTRLVAGARPETVVSAGRPEPVGALGGVRPEVAAPAGGRSETVVPLGRFAERRLSRDQIEGLDIPTFIRRQMD